MHTRLPFDRITTAITWICLGGIALWIALGDFLGRLNADGLVPVLMSLIKWTPYYWGQSRFGMLVPLLALPFRDSMTNLIVQGWLCLFFGLGAFIMVARFFCASRAAVVSGLLAAVLFLGANPRPLVAMYLDTSQPYGTSLFLMFGGLLLLQRARANPSGVGSIAAVFVMVISIWVNPAIVLIAGPAVVLRHFLRPFQSGEVGESLWRVVIPAILIMVFGLALNTIAAKLFATHLGDQVKFIYPNQMPQALSAFFLNLIHETRPWFWLIGLCAVGLALAMQSRASAAGAGNASAIISTSIAIFLVYFAFMGINRATADHGVRYLLPTLVVLSCGATVALVGPALQIRRPGVQLLAALLGVIALFATSAAVFGSPSLTRLRQAIDANYGRYTDALLEAKATHIIGFYWHVWPAVFHANMTLAERGEANRIWGITNRSQAIRELWLDDRMKNAILVGTDDKKQDIPRLCKQYKLTLVQIGQNRGFPVYRVATAKEIAPEANDPDDNQAE